MNRNKTEIDNLDSIVLYCILYVCTANKDIQRVNYIVVEKAHKCFIKPCFQVKGKLYNKMTHRNLQQAI